MPCELESKNAEQAMVLNCRRVHVVVVSFLVQDRSSKVHMTSIGHVNQDI